MTAGPVALEYQGDGAAFGAHQHHAVVARLQQSTTNNVVICVLCNVNTLIETKNLNDGKGVRNVL